MSKRPKFKPMSFVVDLKIYPWDVIVSFGQTEEELYKSLENYLPEPTDNDRKLLTLGKHVGGFVARISSGNLVLRMPHIPYTTEDFGDLAHEIFHVAEQTMENIDCRHDIETGEPWAYLIGYVTKKIYKKINKREEI